MAQISPEQKQSWENSLNGFGEAILGKVGTKLSQVSNDVTTFVETESAARVNADNEILTQIDAVKALHEGKANAFVYVGDTSDVDGRDVVEIFKDNGKTNFKDVTYVIKNVGNNLRNITAVLDEVKTPFNLGNQDGLAVSFDKTGKLISAVEDNNTFDTKLANVYSDVQANYATNSDVADVASAMTAAINNAILRMNAYQL